MDNNNLTEEEQAKFKKRIAQIEDGEMAQAKDLLYNCKNAFQFAKTHSIYVKDWEKTKERMENDLKNNALPSGVSANLHSAIINATDKIIQKKLEYVRGAFEMKFNESIYKYLGSDGKTKNLFGF